jgi:hypothetical protein
MLHQLQNSFSAELDKRMIVLTYKYTELERMGDKQPVTMYNSDLCLVRLRRTLKNLRIA